LLKKRKNAKETKKCTRAYIANSKTVTCYKTDLSSFLGGRPTASKTTTVLTTA